MGRSGDQSLLVGAAHCGRPIQACKHIGSGWEPTVGLPYGVLARG